MKDVRGFLEVEAETAGTQGENEGTMRLVLFELLDDEIAIGAGEGPGVGKGLELGQLSGNSCDAEILVRVLRE